MNTTEQTVWTPPTFNLSAAPSKSCSFELSTEGQNFARCVKIAPDGSSFIAQCEDQSLQIYDFSNSSESEQTVKPTLNLKQAAPVVDFAWFPSASKQDPASYCFAASVRECPVKLLDASTGKLRASYRIVDHRERQIAPHSLAFTSSGERLYCGFEDAIEVFDVRYPGEGTRLHTTPSKKSKDGLKGIISALAFSNYHSTSDELLFAAGSLTPVTGNIALFSGDGEKGPLMFVGGGPRAGVTQLQFNHYRPYMLYAAYRGNASGLIYSWDIRSRIDDPLAIYDGRPESDALQPEEETEHPMSSSKAKNQKLRFDVDIGGRYIGSGNWAGEAMLFDVETVEATLAPNVDGGYEEDLTTLTIPPTLRFNGHQDTVASVAFQPWRAELLTVSGSRHFDLGEEDSSEDEGEDLVEDGMGQAPAKAVVRRKGPTVLDNSIKLWNMASPI